MSAAHRDLPLLTHSFPTRRSSDVVAVLNMDALDPHGPARDFSTSGSAKQDLLDELVATAKRFDLRFTPDSSPEASYFFRSDHFPFAKRGVPAVSFGSRSEEHTSELQSLMRISYAVFCLKKK